MKISYKTYETFFSWFFDEPISSQAIQYYLSYHCNGEGAFIVHLDKSRNSYCLSYKVLNREHNEWQYENLNLVIRAENQIWFEGEDTR